MRMPRRLAAAGLAVVLAVVITALATPMWGRLGSPPAPLGPGDTVVVYGPHRFETPTGSSTIGVESFALNVQSERRYLLRAANGNADGTSRASSGSVVLNGHTIVTVAEIGAAHFADRIVNALPTDTLKVTVEGSAGAFLDVSVREVTAPTFAVDGPRTLVRANGAPETEAFQFTVGASAGAPFYMYVRNGRGDGSQRTSSATISINGQQVLAAGDLSQSVGGLVRQVTLQGTNTVEAMVKSVPASEITVTFVATDIGVPLLTIGEPAPNAITSAATVTVAGTVTDATATTVTVNGAVAARNGTAWSATTTLVEGQNNILVSAVDAAGNQTDSTRTVTRDSQNPALTVTSPADGSFTNQALVTVSGTVTDATTLTVNVNGTPVAPDGSGAFSTQVTLTEASNFVTVTATDQAGNAASVARQVTYDAAAPVITLSAPANNLIINAASVTVSGAVADATATTVTVNGSPVTVGGNGSFSTSVALGEGANTITVIATDAATNSTTATRTVHRDTQSPALVVAAPADAFATRHDTIHVRGTVADVNAVTVTANGIPAPADGAGQYATLVTLAEGSNAVTVVATDAAGNTTMIVRNGLSDRTAPALTVTAPANGSTTAQQSVTVSGTVSDATAVSVTVNGASVTVASGAFSTSAALNVGSNTIAVVATDAVGNVTSQNVLVTRTQSDPLLAESVPMDNSIGAPPVTPGVATNVSSSAAFLYTGASPIQTGVQAGAIEPLSVAVIRGRTITRDGVPLAGVTVRVTDQPKYGQTLTRANGLFDMAVSGFGATHITYTKAGYLPVTRVVTAVPLDYAPTEDVVMTALDTAVTTIAFTQPIEVARASVQTDADGARRQTLMFQQGTAVTMTLPNGTTQPLTGPISVRATEYTVGPNGQKAMPAVLPPSSGYTYAVDLTVDEAMAAGATMVSFDKTVYAYNENFLELPVGFTVPNGYYDPARRAWLAEANGRVIRIIATDNGVATISVNAAHTAAPADTLAALGFTLAEREKLAVTYSTGQELWRMPVTHFSILDFNLAFLCQFGFGFCQSPNLNTGNSNTNSDNDPSSKPDPDEADCQDSASGSIIYCQRQALGEVLRLTGTPYQLYYQSNRAPGYRAANVLSISLVRDAVPAGVEQISLELRVGGRKFERTFQPSAGLRYQFLWDGMDAYGRRMLGQQPVTVRVGYSYSINYMNSTVALAFGRPGDTVSTVPGRALFTNWTEYTDRIGQFDFRSLGLGGWTLSNHHVYDVVGKRLLRGDGGVESAETMSSVIRTVVGRTNVGGFSGDGGPASSATFTGGGAAFAFGPDGALYLGADNRIRRVGTDGVIRRIAGTGTEGNSGDGGPALSAAMTPSYMTFLPDGSLAFYNGATLFVKTIRRVGPDSVVRVVAGGGQSQADGVPATQALLFDVRDIAAGPDGSIYIADVFLKKVRRVTPGGFIETVAGNGSCTTASNPPDGVARQVTLCLLRMAVGPDGSVYVSESALNNRQRIRRITPDGRIRTVAGSTSVDDSPDGTPALQAGLGNIRSLAVGPDHTIYFMSSGNKLRAITPDGFMRTVAGDGSGSVSGVEGTLAATDFSNTQERAMAVAPDGAVFVVDETNRLRRIASPYAGVSVTDMVMPSRDASVLYVFSGEGRHRRTIDAVTAVTLETFQYDSIGRLTGVLDTDSLRTTFERDGQGKLSGIVGPFGQRTAITTDADGFVVSAKAPATTPYVMTYESGPALGLLASFRDPATGLHSFAYDTLGRLLANTNQSGTQTLARSDSAQRYRITHTNAVGVVTGYDVIGLASGASRQLTRHPGSRADSSTFEPTGSATHVTADGTRITTTQRADPRFGSSASFTNQVTVDIPGIPQAQILASRGVMLATPGDPLSLQRIADTTRVGSGATLGTFVTAYDAATRSVAARSAQARTDSTYLDPAGRPIRFVSPGVASRTVEYDSIGRMRRAVMAGRATRFSYNAAGLVDTIVDALQRRTRFIHDSAGRTTGIVRTDGRTIGLAYDSAGRLTSLTPPGKPAHQFAYDAAGLLSAYTPPPLPGGISTPTSYAYDGAQRLSVIRRPTGDSVAFAYDSAGRLRSATHSVATVTTAYNALTGLPSSIATTSDGGQTISLTYAGSLPTAITQSGGGVTGTVSFAYDNRVRVSSIGVGGLAANQVAHSYDLDNLLTQVGNQTFTRSATTGFVTGTALGVFTTALTYDSLGSVATETWGSDSVYRYVLTRDSLQRIVGKTERIQGTTIQWGYAYDSVGRLSEVVRDGVVSASYSYDDNGNRLSRASTAGTELGVYDDQDRLVSYAGAQYQYSLSGELTHRIVGTDTTRYTYDALGALRSVRLPDGTQVDYVIDALGRRIGRKVNGTFTHRFIYESNLRIAAEVNASGEVTTRYVYGEKSNVPEYMLRDGVFYRLITDQLGSVRLVVRASTGQVFQRIDYDEFGRVLGDSNAGFQPFAFAGGLRDNLTGLIRFGARDFVPELGRWMTLDQLRFAAGRTNLYAYANSNPVGRIDPSGLCDIEIPKSWDDVKDQIRDVWDTIKRNWRKLPLPEDPLEPRRPRPEDIDLTPPPPVEWPSPRPIPGGPGPDGKRRLPGRNGEPGPEIKWDEMVVAAAALATTLVTSSLPSMDDLREQLPATPPMPAPAAFPRCFLTAAGALCVP